MPRSMPLCTELDAATAATDASHLTSRRNSCIALQIDIDETCIHQAIEIRPSPELRARGWPFWDAQGVPSGAADIHKHAVALLQQHQAELTVIGPGSQAVASVEQGRVLASMAELCEYNKAVFIITQVCQSYIA